MTELICFIHVARGPEKENQQCANILLKQYELHFFQQYYVILRVIILSTYVFFFFNT